MKIEKRFPAETGLENKTFLNDKKINAELYAYLQSKSMADGNDVLGYETRVYFKDLPPQAEICKLIGIKSPKTYRTHLAYLMEKGYVVQGDGYYILNNKENAFLMVPLDTLKFLIDVLKENIIKIYVYLGQRYKYALANGFQYEFTIKELAEHIGIKVEGNSRGYEMINNALDALADLGLINYVSYYNGSAAKKKLTGYSFSYIKNKVR